MEINHLNSFRVWNGFNLPKNLWFLVMEEGQEMIVWRLDSVRMHRHWVISIRVQDLIASFPCIYRWSRRIWNGQSDEPIRLSKDLCQNLSKLAKLLDKTKSRKIQGFSTHINQPKIWQAWLQSIRKIKRNLNEWTILPAKRRSLVQRTRPCKAAFIRACQL